MSQNNFSDHMSRFINHVSKRQAYLWDESHFYSWKAILMKFADNVKPSTYKTCHEFLDFMLKEYCVNQCDVCNDRCLSVDCLRQLFDISDSEEEVEDDESVDIDIFYQVFKNLSKYSSFKYNLNELPKKQLNGCDLLMQICQRRAMFCGTSLVNKVNRMKIDLEFVPAAGKQSLFLTNFYDVIDETIDFKKSLCKLHRSIKGARSDLRRSARCK